MYLSAQHRFVIYANEKGLGSQSKEPFILLWSVQKRFCRKGVFDKGFEGRIGACWAGMSLTRSATFGKDTSAYYWFG